jgi:hypothetical protein
MREDDPGCMLMTPRLVWLLQIRRGPAAAPWMPLLLAALPAAARRMDSLGGEGGKLYGHLMSAVPDYRKEVTGSGILGNNSTARAAASKASTQGHAPQALLLLQMVPHSAAARAPALHCVLLRRCCRCCGTAPARATWRTLTPWRATAPGWQRYCCTCLVRVSTTAYTTLQ